ncbi:MAG: InlB B-repeat-containing protein [Anaerotignaceae bacterium]
MQPNVAGISGSDHITATIINCYNTGNIYVGNSGYGAGIAAFPGTVTGCFNTGTISGPEGATVYLAGIAYGITPEECNYCDFLAQTGLTIDGIGSVTGQADSNYFTVSTSGTAYDNFYATASWDFTNTWRFVNGGYPLLMAFPAPYSATLSAGGSITESNLNGSTITLTLAGTTYNSSLTAGNFTLSNAPAGVTVSSVNRTGDTTCDVTLAYDGTDFDEDKNMSITIAGSEVASSSVITSDTVTITAVIEVAPTATTSTATSVTTTTATLNGSVNANNASTTVTFEYGTDTSYGTSVTAEQSPVMGTSLTAVSYSLTGLTPNTTYHYRVVGVNGAGTTYGDDQTFTTTAVASTATTSTATSVTATTATLNGSVNANNASTTVTFEYGTDTSYGTSVTAEQSPVMGTSLTAVSYSLTGLTPNTTYHYKVIGMNGAGTTNGNDQTFTTTAVAPTATTSTPTSVTTTTATLNGSVNANNASTTVTFEYGTDTSYGTSVTADESPVTGTSLTSVSYSLTGLIPNTTYHYRVVGTSTGGTGYGSDETFTTQAIAPFATTSSATGITDTEATVNGSVNANNAATNVTFEYGTSTSYGTSVTAVPSPVTGTSLTAVSYSLTGLTPNTTYHYRVVGINSAGTDYGNDQTFTTTVAPPTKLSTITGLAWGTVNKAKAIWDEESSASSYSIQLYKDGAASGSEVTGITTPYYDFTSVITDAGAYTYSVTAIGDGTSYSDSDSATVASSLSVYAVTFKNNYSDSDTTAYTTNILFDGSKATAPTEPTRTGYTFGGWYTENSCATAWDFANNSVTNDTNLYAKWETVVSTTYTVTYNGNGATSGTVPVDSNAYTSGSAAEVKGNTGSLTKEGYTFGGWSNSGTTYSAGENVTVLGNTTLTAVWNAVQSTYTATYNLNYAGSGVYTTQTSIVSGAFLTAPSEPSRSGYSFSGWYKDTACAERWQFSTNTVTGNMNLYAKWSADTYTVMGTVVDDEETPAGINGATVIIKMGNIQIGATGTTDMDGSFIITDVPNGIYNLVVEYSGKTVTKIIKVENSSFVLASTIVIPTQSKSSVVVISGTNTPPVVVGGLDNEVNNTNTTTTSSTFIITLTVEENTSSANANDVSQEATTSGKLIGLIFDIDLNKMEDGVEDTSYNETSNLLEIMIPLPEQLQGKESYAIYRYHEGAVDKITEDINAYGEYIEVDSGKTTLTLHAKKFSTYAIAYTAATTYSVLFAGGEGATGTAPTQADTAEGVTITLPANTFSKTKYTFAGWNDGTNTYSAGTSYIMQDSSVTFTAHWTYSGTHSSSGGGSSAIATSYTITTSAGQGGSISPENASVLKGASKTFAIKADTGYEVTDVKVDGTSVGAVSSYTFSNTSANHTIQAVFSVEEVEEKVIEEGLPYYIDGHGNNVFIGIASDASGTMKYIAPEDITVLWKENPKSFTDISDHWAKAYIDFVTERELFLGTSSNTFSPNSGMTRGMFATVIGRLYERSYGEIATADNRNKFTDVNYDLYYADYIDWVSSNNIITGVGNGNFEPNREITREEMAVILYRFANFLNISIEKTEVSQQSYHDASAISNWAIEGTEYCRQTGMISGRDGGNFVPKGNATRAEVAAILERFINKAVE